MAQAFAATAAAEDEAAVVSYFEVHVRRDQRWVIDCITHAPSDALAEAEDILRRVEVSAVKVVNERYNPRTDRSASRVVFAKEKAQRPKRSGPLVMVAARAVARPPADAEMPASDAPPDPGPVARARVARRGDAASPVTAPWLLFAWASLALALGASLLFLLLLVTG